MPEDNQKTINFDNNLFNLVESLVYKARQNMHALAQVTGLNLLPVHEFFHIAYNISWMKLLVYTVNILSYIRCVPIGHFRHIKFQLDSEA